MNSCQVNQRQTPQPLSTVMNLVRGSKVWVEDDQFAWVAAEIVDVQMQHVTARTEKGKKMAIVPISRVYLRDENISPRGEDDMTKLAYLHEPGVLYNLASRYELNEIYTYTGNILIAVNPFMKLPHLYDSHMMDQYRGAIFGELSPHVFAIADSAYRAMIYKNQSQVILVSGESGAGKTETTKLIMQYLAFVGGRAGRAGRTANDGRTVEQQVLESNPLLEAFGNAKTMRNDNSSRFGKFVEIHFNSTGKISGAAIRTYLLERSRVVQLNNQERNYHCFYQLCSSSIDAKRYKLMEPRTFHYLNQSKCFLLHGVDDALEYTKTRRAMTIVGISPEEQDAIFRTLAAILHLGNINFEPGEEHDSSLLKHDESYFHLQTAAELLMCNIDSLKDTLCTRIILAHGEVIKKMLDPETAIINRDALSKTIYSHLFDWLVDKINKSIGQDMESLAQIGLLDIYGFESFPNNSFEQFCINFANEKLQQHFNEHALKLEQEEYNNEGIDWSYIEYVDNQDVLDLIEKRPMGVIALLDEACMFPKSTSETFASKLFHAFKNNERFRKPKLSSTDFIISHYAGEVVYQTDLFIDKNKDFVIVEHQALLESSRDPFVCGLFTTRADHKMKPSYKFSSVASRFKQQLQLLMETLSASEPHYIRCVKPNGDSKPGKFENQSVLHQLKCAGVLEAVRISCAGHPTRTPYHEFLNRFGFLASNIISGYTDKRTATEKLLEHMKIMDYRLGITKVFLRTGHMADLEARRAEALVKAINVIQQRTKSYILRKRFLMIRNATLCIQAHWRGYLDRIIFRAKRKEAATILIQCMVRMWLARKTYLFLRKAIIRIQRRARIFLAQKQGAVYFEANRSAIIQVKTEESEDGMQKEESQHDFFKMEKHKPIELAMWGGAPVEMEKMNGGELGKLQSTVAKMKETKRTELARLQSALLEIEVSKAAEVERLQTALTEMRQSKEVESKNLQAEIRKMEESKKAELKKLRAELVKMEESKKAELKKLQAQLFKMEESKKAEMARHQSEVLEMKESKALEVTNLQYVDHTKEAELAKQRRMPRAVHQTERTSTRKSEEWGQLTLFETDKPKQQEFVKVEKAKLSSLQNALTEMEKSKQEAVARLEAALRCMEESKNAEVAELQTALLEMEESKRNEVSRMQSALLQNQETHAADLVRLQSTIHQMEEKKGAELARLQNALLEMQQQAESMGILILKERETNKILSMQLASLIKLRSLLEITEAKVYQLAKENGQLRILKDIHENKSLEAERELIKARKDGDERVEKSKEADSRMDKVQETLDRLEEKMTYMELENQALRKQAGVFSPSGHRIHRTRSDIFDSDSASVEEQLIIKISPERHDASNFGQDTPERQCPMNGDQRSFFRSPAKSLSMVHHATHQSESIQQRLIPENRPENQDILVEWIAQDVGFSNGNPIVACTIYKCLLHWNAFQSERTNIFDRLALTIGACIEAQESDDILSYWLSNVSILLHLGHHHMKPHEAPYTPITPNTPRRLGLLSRMTNSFRSPSRFKRFYVKRGLSSLDSLCQAEVKTPAAIFKQHLIIFVEKLYGLLRDNLKKDISPMLTACIQAPRASWAKGQPLGPYTVSSLAHNSATAHWSRITDCLNSLFNKLHANHVPPFFVCKIFTQIFSFINAQLFNSLLLRRECCSFSNGEYLRAGLAELETWISGIPQEYAGDSWEELQLIRQAVTFLVIHQKPQRTFEEIRQDLCPGLSIQQLYRISTMYWDDKYGTHSVSQEVMACMKKHMAEESKKSSGSSFLLDDDSSIPFSVEEILVSMPRVDPDAVEYPPQLLMRETTSAVRSFEYPPQSVSLMMEMSSPAHSVKYPSQLLMREMASPVHSQKRYSHS